LNIIIGNWGVMRGGIKELGRKLISVRRQSAVLAKKVHQGESVERRHIERGLFKEGRDSAKGKTIRRRTP